MVKVSRNILNGISARLVGTDLGMFAGEALDDRACHRQHALCAGNSRTAACP